jgi:hypothetical protein
MGRHSAGEPDQSGVAPGGTGQPPEHLPSSSQRPMPPCYRCGAPFAAHTDGGCPTPQTSTDRVAAQPRDFAAAGEQRWVASMPSTPQQQEPWVPSAGLPHAPWAPLRPPGMPQMARVLQSRRNWLRRHPWLTALIAIVVVGISVAAIDGASQPSDNATACSAYWSIKNAPDTAAEGTGLQNLEAAMPHITNSGLSVAVEAFQEDLNNDDMSDAETATIAIGTACTALGYSNPG